MGFSIPRTKRQNQSSLFERTICNSLPHSQILRLTTMNERAERINGWAAMIGIVAAMGAYALTGQIIPGIW